ncbi:MAG: hypothetical protein J5836_00715 [Clostridia bacterium]|nr:hypothetical protein [Clostridia bacterium]
MKDFNSYTPEKKEKDLKNELGDKSAFEFLSSLSAKYEGKSGEEIMKAILKEAEKGRKNGTLTDADIDNFAAMISPMLNDKQKKTLDSVVKRLKS